MRTTRDLTPARRTTLSTTATETIRRSILDGTLPAGKAVAQAVLAKQLGTSQGPVRDALAVLEREGLVRKTSTNRTVVVRLARADIEELVEVRTALEVLAVRLAVVRADDGDFARLEDNIRATEQARTSRAGVDLDMAFHELLIEAGRNRRLLGLWRSLAPQLRIILHRAFTSPPHSNRTAAIAHRRLVDLIRRREEARAVTFVESQMVELREWAVRVFDPAS